MILVADSATNVENHYHIKWFIIFMYCLTSTGVPNYYLLDDAGFTTFSFLTLLFFVSPYYNPGNVYKITGLIAVPMSALRKSGWKSAVLHCFWLNMAFQMILQRFQHIYRTLVAVVAEFSTNLYWSRRVARGRFDAAYRLPIVHSAQHSAATSEPAAAKRTVSRDWSANGLLYVVRGRSSSQGFAVSQIAL